MAKKIKKIIEEMRDKEGALLPVLHEVQKHAGCINKEAVVEIANGLNLSRAEVHGVISFYPDFHSKPIGKNIVQICRAEACQSMGSKDLENHAKQQLGLDFGETSDDGQITLEPVYCLGNCACSPSVAINHKTYARVDAARFDDLLVAVKGGKA